jgi:Tfp pilus assembly protein PilE
VRASGLIGLLIVVLIFGFAAWYYMTRSTPAGQQSTFVQAIDTAGAQAGLLAIAQAERSYFTEHGSYASLDELTSSGALPAARAQRRGYTLSIETSTSGFTATARCESVPGQTCTSFAVDEMMNVHAVP